jgi:hypothetical protein
VKTTRDRVALFMQPVEGPDGLPGWFFDQFNIFTYFFLKPSEMNFVKKITGYKLFQSLIYGPQV